MGFLRRQLRADEPTPRTSRANRYGVDAAIRRLQRHGCHVERRDWGRLLVNGLHVEVRVGRETYKRHHVTVHGKAYSYLYTRCIWNLHRRGRRVHCDYWLVIDQDDHAAAVVPDAMLHGPTLHRHVGAQPDEHSLFGRYRERWDLLRSVRAGVAA